MKHYSTAVAIAVASFLEIGATRAEDVAANCPTAAPPVREVLKKAEAEGLKLITHQRPQDGALIQSKDLPEDEWFTLQRAHFSKRVSLGIPSGQNDFYLYEDSNGKMIVILAARGCYIGTMTRDRRWKI